MSAHQYVKQIEAARGTMVRARNPWFRQYWHDVAESLLKRVTQHG